MRKHGVSCASFARSAAARAFSNSRSAEALELEPSQVEEAREATLREIRRREEKEAIRSFRPHAIFLTEHRIPTQIVIAGIVGADLRRYVHFDDDTAPESYKDIVLAAMPATIPFFGRVQGFMINYRPDYAVQYDTAGNVVEEFSPRFRETGRIRIRF